MDGAVSRRGGGGRGHAYARAVEERQVVGKGRRRVCGVVREFGRTGSRRVALAAGRRRVDLLRVARPTSNWRVATAGQFTGKFNRVKRSKMFRQDGVLCR